MGYNLLIIIIYALSRFPFLDAGFGTDGDAWRIIENGLHFITDHEYKWSRFPGYPLYEILIYFLTDKGPIITNLVSAISGLFCVIIFKNILQTYLDIDHRKSTLISLIFCFTPVVWIASTITMDYLFAELFLLLAWFSLGNANHKYISGVFLGLAMGARPNNIIFIIPMMVGLFLIEVRNNIFYIKIAKSLAIYLFSCVITSILVMMPVFLKYGVSSLLSTSSGLFFSNISIIIIGYNLIKVSGVIGLITFVVLSFLILFHHKSEIKGLEVIRDPNFIISFLGIIINILLFILLPDEPFYLIPSIPFALYCLTAFTNNIHQSNITFYLSIFLSILLISNIIDLKLWERDNTGKNSLVEPYIGKGIFKDDHDARKGLINESEFIFKTGNFKTPCIIMTGWHFPIVRTYKKYYLEKKKCDCDLVQLLDKNSLIAYIENDVNIYFTNGVEYQTNQVHQYSLNDFNNLNYINF